MTTYTPTRPIMGRDELAGHHLSAHGRDYTVADDGWEDMEDAQKHGWRPLSCWGADGWDLGNWPYVSIQIKTEPGSTVLSTKYFIQSICEGDHDIYVFDTEADRDSALDYLHLWAIETYLPTSRHDLRQQIEQATGIDHSDVGSMFHLLAVLADIGAPESVRP